MYIIILVNISVSCSRCVFNYLCREFLCEVGVVAVCEDDGLDILLEEFDLLRP
jgi:hypothetical protein